MDELTVSIIKTELIYGDPSANLINFSKKIEQVKVRTDIIILPEMFTTSFSMDTSLAEIMDGKYAL